MSLAQLVPANLKLTTEHVDTLLELAYLATAVDGRLDEQELVAYKEIAERLQGKELSTADVDALLDRFAAAVEHAEVGERLAVLAPKLPENLRRVAFKLAIGISVADLDASADESDLQALLAEALGFDDQRVDELTAETYAMLDAGES